MNVEGLLYYCDAYNTLLKYINQYIVACYCSEKFKILF